MTDEHDESRSDALAALVRAHAPHTFEAGFSERVMARLRAEEQPLSAALERQFIRIVPLAAAASLLLAAMNWWGARSTHTSVIDAALNLPQVSLATAYASNSLYEGDAGTQMP